MGTPGPPSLQTFLLRQEFWQRIGMTLESLERLPEREIEEYALIIQLLQRQEQADQRKANSGRR